jgi:hypothetical protein
MISYEEFNDFLNDRIREEPGNKYYKLNTSAYYSIITHDSVWIKQPLEYKILLLIHFRYFPLKVEAEFTTTLYNLYIQSGFIQDDDDAEQLRFYELAIKFN